jgi:hypothetical protein
MDAAFMSFQRHEGGIHVVSAKPEPAAAQNTSHKNAARTQEH